jgi:hypothetical protein
LPDELHAPVKLHLWILRTCMVRPSPIRKPPEWNFKIIRDDVSTTVRTPAERGGKRQHHAARPQHSFSGMRTRGRCAVQLHCGRRERARARLHCSPRLSTIVDQPRASRVPSKGNRTDDRDREATGRLQEPPSRQACDWRRRVGRDGCAPRAAVPPPGRLPLHPAVAVPIAAALVLAPT